MKTGRNFKLSFLVVAILSYILYLAIGQKPPTQTKPQYLSYVVDPKLQELRFFSKDDQNKKLLSIRRLLEYLVGSGQELVSAMNGGMYQMDFTPKLIFS